MSNDAGSGDTALQAMSDALLSITAEVTVERAFQKMVDAARTLAGARYAALGIPDGEGGFEQFITSGISDEEIARIGPLPRTHGLLGAMLEDPAPFRSSNIQQDARFWGWPATHPDMRSFLGVPIVAKSLIIGAFYLTDKITASDFSADDQKVIEMLAAHAAISIENARLYERSRELSVIEERNRLARDLHDSVTQTLFSLALTAEAADTLIGRDVSAAKAQLEQLKRMAQEAVREMRSLIFELRPADLELDGLIGTLRKHVDVLRQVRGADLDLRITGERRLPELIERDIFRVAQEALNNALKHAGADTIGVELDLGSPVTLTIHDDGTGFDPNDPRIRARRLGLTSMRERADGMGARLSIDSVAAAGTTVRLEVDA